MPKTLVDQVEAQVSRVHAVWLDALDATTPGALSSLSSLFGADQSQNAHNAIKSLKPRIDEWADTGLRAAKADEAPPTGWSRWTKAGEIILDGIDDIWDIGERGALDDIAATVKDIPKHAAQDIQRAAKKAGKAVDGVTKVAAGAAFDVIKPLLPWAAGALAVAIIVNVGVPKLAARFLK